MFDAASPGASKLKAGFSNISLQGKLNSEIGEKTNKLTYLIHRSILIKN